MGTHPIFESDFDCLTDGDHVSSIAICSEFDWLRANRAAARLAPHHVARPLHDGGVVHAQRVARRFWRDGGAVVEPVHQVWRHARSADGSGGDVNVADGTVRSLSGLYSLVPTVNGPRHSRPLVSLSRDAGTGQRQPQVVWARFKSDSAHLLHQSNRPLSDVCWE